MTLHLSRSASRTVLGGDPARQAFLLLRATFTVAPARLAAVYAPAHSARTRA